MLAVLMAALLFEFWVLQAVCRGRVILLVAVE